MEPFKGPRLALCVASGTTYRVTRILWILLHWTQRSQDTTKNNWRKPWLCVCRKRTCFIVQNIGGREWPLAQPLPIPLVYFGVLEVYYVIDLTANRTCFVAGAILDFLKHWTTLTNTIISLKFIQWWVFCTSLTGGEYKRPTHRSWQNAVYISVTGSF